MVSYSRRITGAPVGRLVWGRKGRVYRGGRYVEIVPAWIDAGPCMAAA